MSHVVGVAQMARAFLLTVTFVGSVALLNAAPHVEKPATESPAATPSAATIPAPAAPETPAAPAKITHVIHISVDGLGSHWLRQGLKENKLPGFERLMKEGAGTLNARTDYDFTITLPNHTCMVTGRPVNDVVCDDRPYSGHEWKINDDNQPQNLHVNRRDYVASVFDVAHDRGLSTELYSSKSKFKIYSDSYGPAGGAIDICGPDNGRAKIDRSVITPSDSKKMMKQWLKSYTTDAPNYSFVHFHDCDGAGHKFGWGSPEYWKALQAVDVHLVKMFETIEANPQLARSTVIILSADHGGQGRGHANKENPLDYSIPFFVWGADVPQGNDLYKLNPKTRLDPGPGRPAYALTGQPIRNGDGGNLALSLLGLPQIPGSLINSRQDLVVIPHLGSGQRLGASDQVGVK